MPKLENSSLPDQVREAKNILHRRVMTRMVRPRRQPAVGSGLMLLAWITITLLSPGGHSFTRGRSGAGEQVTLRCQLCKRQNTYAVRPSDDDDSAWICKNRHRPRRRKVV